MGHEYYTVHRFMTQKLGLRGAELQIYALIHSFSRDGSTPYRGSRKYIAETIGVCTKTVERGLMSLTRRGLLIKEEVDSYFAQFSYRVNLSEIERLSRMNARNP